jgi:acetyl-CoA carboxylase carboxyl transferase subunit alpha
MVRLKVPIITIIVGEGASGGALGIGVGDRVYMLGHLVFCNFSRILFFYFMEKLEYKEIAAEAFDCQT